jgi:hypothetical protein
MTRVRPVRWLVGFLAAALAGIGIFAVLAWQRTDVTTADEHSAAAAFAAARSAFANPASLLVRDATGSIVRRPDAPPPRRQDLSHLRVMAYDAADRRLVEVDVPFWFFRLKGPAVNVMVRGTGLDLADLGVTAADLERQGPCVVLDEAGQGGSRLMVWTE